MPDSPGVAEVSYTRCVVPYIPDAWNWLAEQFETEGQAGLAR